jgi:prepilin peptidase CpaA
MPSPDFASYMVAYALTGVLAWAAYSDSTRRLIPNRSVLAIVGLFAIWSAAHGFEGLLPSVLTAFAMLVVAIGFYAIKWFGAGDAKLFAALTLFSGFAHLGGFVAVMALTGGVLALLGLALDPRRAFGLLAARGIDGEPGRGVPYGVAISFAGAFTVWAGMTHFLSPVF